MAIKKHRSPSYPGITLEEALHRAKAFYKHEGKHEALVPTALTHWGYSTKSSGGLIAIAALKAYDLMADKGSGAQRMVSLTPFGLKIIMDERTVSPDRDAAMKQAALNPKIMGELWDKYGTDLPSRETLRHFLRVDKEFGDSAVNDVIKIYISNLAFAGLEKSDPINGADSGADEGETAELTDDALEQRGSEPIGDVTSFAAKPQPKAFKGFVESAMPTPAGEEIGNYRVSKSTTIRLLSNGPYSRKSIESLVKQLQLALDLGNFDDLEDADDVDS